MAGLEESSVAILAALISSPASLPGVGLPPTRGGGCHHGLSRWACRTQEAKKIQTSEADTDRLFSRAVPVSIQSGPFFAFGRSFFVNVVFGFL